MLNHNAPHVWSMSDEHLENRRRPELVKDWLLAYIYLALVDSENKGLQGDNLY